MKIFLIIMIVLCLLLLAFLVFLIVYTFKRDKTHSSNEQLMQGNVDKSALIIYQPSIHNGNISISNAIAVTLHENGYNVTINRPSPKLKYKLSKFDIIAFGSGVYMGKAASPLYNFINSNNKFLHKKVFIYLTGVDVVATRELNSLKKLIPDGNDIFTIKIQKNEIDKATDFIKQNL